MKVLSLFDGISCARLALDRVGIKVTDYYASEIDRFSIEIVEKNYDETIQLGNVLKVKYIDGQINFEDVEYTDKVKIDLLIGGSPCQDLSIAKKDRKGLDGKKSGLFWEYVRILKEVKPKYFILENVNSMSKHDKRVITNELGVDPIMINASLVSAQNRKRLFRTNIHGVTQPKDKGILLKDVLEGGNNEVRKDSRKYREGKPRYYKGKCPTLSANMGTAGGHIPLTYIKQKGRGFNKGGEHYDKSPTLTSNSWEQNNKLVIKPVALRNRGEGKKPEYNKTGKANAMTTVQTDSMVDENDIIRKLTPVECERLQGVPDNYTEGVSNSQRYKMLGNAFNVDVVAHILSFIK